MRLFSMRIIQRLLNRMVLWITYFLGFKIILWRLSKRVLIKKAAKCECNTGTHTRFGITVFWDYSLYEPKYLRSYQDGRSLERFYDCSKSNLIFVTY